MAPYTPWGTAQSSCRIAPGIVEFSTASHGGIYLSARRQARMPEYMRANNGWYEEDVAAVLPAVVFAIEFERYRQLNAAQYYRDVNARFARHLRLDADGLSESEKTVVEAIASGIGEEQWAVAQAAVAAKTDKETLRNEFPDAYERFYGEQIKPGESRARDEETFYGTHAKDWIVVAAWGDWEETVTEGMVKVCARIGGHRNASGEEQYFLVPQADYKVPQQFGFLVDPDRYETCAPPTGRSKKDQLEEGPAFAR